MQRRSPLTTVSLCVGFVLPLLVFLGSFMARSAAGQTLWEGNGHYYLVVEEELSWEEARSRAESMLFMDVQGHLATITLEDENTFVTTQLGDTVEAWLGGEQRPDSEEPAGGWQWITGEPWVYTNWDAGEPNNFGGSEERLQYGGIGRWNDAPADPFVSPRFIVEWDVPVDTDCVEPSAGLVGWWPLDETSGTTATDIISGNDGTYMGDPTPVTGNVAGALSFDGIDDETFVTSTFPFHQLGDATLEFWLNTPATGHQSVFWTRADAEDANRFHIYVNEDSTFGFDYRSPSGELHSLVEAVSIPRNTWTHLAITRTGNVYNLYINGVLAASATDPSPDLPTAAGWQIAGQGQIDFRYNGSLDEVSLYNRALSEEEIAAIYTAGSAGKCRDSGPGQMYDAAADFSATSNPNGVWSYGYLAPGPEPDPTTFTLYLEPFQSDDVDPPGALDVWGITSQGESPTVAHNGTTSPVTHEPPIGEFGDIIWAPGQLSFHPGPSGEYSVVRWKAPRTGIYTIAATFTGIDSHPTSTDVHVLHNSSMLFTDIINEYQMPHAFSTTRSVAAGDILDFIVGVGPNETYDFDTTALDVTIMQQETAPCTLHLASSVTEGTLTLDFQLGTQEPATWNVWLTAQNEIMRLLSLPLSVIDPPVRAPFTIPFVPPLGTVGILTTLTTPDQGILCSDFSTVDTGPVSEDAAVAVQELQDVLQPLVQWMLHHRMTRVAEGGSYGLQEVTDTHAPQNS